MQLNRRGHSPRVHIERTFNAMLKPGFMSPLA